MAQEPPPNLLQLLPEELVFHVLNRIFDVPEVVSLRRTDSTLRALTRNPFFIEYFNNNRDQSPVWLFGHSNTELHPLFGVLWGYRLADNRMMIQPVVLLGQPFEFNAARFLDVDQSHFLLMLTPNHTMLVINPFEGRQTLIHLPPHMFPGNMLNVAHHLSITSDHHHHDRFRIVYARLVNHVPMYHLYHSHVGVWVAQEAVLAGNNQLLGGINMRVTVADDDNHLLYTIYHPVDNHDPVYTVAQIWDHHVADPELFSSVVFVADFAIVRRYSVWIPHMVSFVEVLLYRHMDAAAAPGFVLLGMMDLPQELLGLNAFHSMHGRVIGPILYIHVLTRGNVAMGGPQAHPLLFVFRYHIHNAQWLQRIRIPFPDIAAFLHSTPAFTHRLTLVNNNN